MKFAHQRKHQKTNQNCERMLREYGEQIHLGNTSRAEVLRKRIVSRYGKEVLLTQ